MRVEDALSALTFPYLMPIRLSFDGRLVAYMLQDLAGREPAGGERYALFTPTGASRFAQGSDIWITDTQTGEEANLTKGIGTNWAPAWSPDGSSLAFYSDRSGYAALWVWDRGSGQIRQVSDAIVRSFCTPPAWTPDSRSMLVRLVPEGLAVEQMAGLAQGPRRKDFQPGQPTVTVYDTQANSEPSDACQVGGGSHDYLLMGDLALVKVSDGTLRRLARRVRPAWYAASPDGCHVAFTHLVGPASFGSFQQLWDLVVVNLAADTDLEEDGNLSEETKRTVAGHIPLSLSGTQVAWSPAGERLWYITSGPKAAVECYSAALAGGEAERMAAARGMAIDESSDLYWSSPDDCLHFTGGNALWCVSGATGEVKALRLEEGYQLRGVVAGQQSGRLWMPHSSPVVVALHQHTMRWGFHALDLETGVRTELLSEDRSYGTHYSVQWAVDISADGQTVVYLSEDAQHCQDLWVVGSADLLQGRQLTHSNPGLEGEEMGASRLIEWRGLDGQRLRGALLLPAGYQTGTRYPLVVVVYGGTLRSDMVNRFGLNRSGYGIENMQVLATCGYAVLFPDAPVNVGTPMLDLAKTILPGVDRVIELGVADSERLGVMGHSYGGYSTLALVVQTTRFKAAVVRAGPVSLVESYSLGKDGSSWGVAWVEEGQGGMGGSLWQYRDRFVENSPIFYLDRVETPVLLLQGDLDSGSVQSDRTFACLRRLGKRAVYARYVGEDHWEGEWSYPNMLDQWHRVISWFDEHLGPRD